MSAQDEILAGVLRRILRDPERHPAQDPYLWIADTEFVFDGRVSVTALERDALLAARVDPREAKSK